jgi:hypothetical protein
MAQVIKTRGTTMHSPARTILGAIVAGSLLASSGAQAGSRRGNLFAGALAGAAVGVLAGSAFAAPPPPPPVYVYRPRPAWPAYAPSRIEVYHGDDWDDHADDDWDD